MRSVYEHPNCCGCTACQAVCPKGAITMKPDREGFSYPVIDQSRCIDCGLCRKVCPALEVPEFHGEPEVYAVQLKDWDSLSRSQSGGAFWAIARTVLDLGGVVYGAAFDGALRVVYQRAESAQQAEAFRGSKYVQADMGQVLHQVKNDLQEGRKVLFSGTACHIAGLLKFLGKGYDGLYTCDLICHGVPTPMLLEKYFAYLEKKHGAKVKRFYSGYYDASYGWDAPRRERVEFSDGRCLDSSMYIDCFNCNWNLRPYCHRCPYAGQQRITDFTVGDFWGAEACTQAFDLKRGCSVLFFNSSRSKALFDGVMSHLHYEPQSMEQVIRKQPNLQSPTPQNRRREKMMDCLIRRGFGAAHRWNRFYMGLYALKQAVLRKKG